MVSVLDQIKKLDEQKAALIEGAKIEALAAANAAIATLKELGYSYKLVEGSGVVTGGDRTSVSTGSGGRRIGIRDQVLETIKSSDGINRADLIEAMGGKGNKSAEQSISNALSALKKASAISQTGKIYKAT